MSTWIVGDVHGHFGALERLLAAMDYTSSDHIIFVGDLVNGGGQSAEVVRWCADHDAIVTLGNHDLHMLAVFWGAREARKKDDFLDVLEAPDAHELIEWLQCCPMTYHLADHNALVVHAGILPSWTVQDAVAVGGEVEVLLQDFEDEKLFFEDMYGNKPARWNEGRRGASRYRCAINALTRMRILNKKEKMEFDFSSVYGEIPKNWSAWFDHHARKDRETLIVFGHWSALGARVFEGANVVCLDGGVRWGRELAAMRVEDRKIVRVASA